jgi:predicted TIM-barrel fold metal-dependent hydrolase
VFSGIGEFTIHKEFVSSKLSSDVPTLSDPALGRILDFAGEVGLLVIIHNDMDTPFPDEGAHPMFLAPMKALLRRHPRTRIIWSHIGVGRIIRPVKDHLRIIEGILKDPAYEHVCFDISWDEVAKYLETTPTTAGRAAALLRQFPDRFLFGTDLVGPTDRRKYMAVFEQYDPLWALLDRATREKVVKGNHQRLFDEARRRVRAWEHAHGLGLSNSKRNGHNGHPSGRRR